MLHEVCELYGKSQIRQIEIEKELKTSNKTKTKSLNKELKELRPYFDYVARVFYYYQHEYKPYQYIKDYEQISKLCDKCEFYDEDLKLCNAVAKRVDSFKGCPRKQLRESLRIIKNIFMMDGEANPLNRKIISLEEEFNIVLDNGVPIRGFVDIFVEADENTLEVNDWKMGAWQVEQKDAHDDIQLRLYALAGSILYPQYEYQVCNLEYPRYYGSKGKNPPVVTAMFGPEDHEKTKDIVLKAWNKTIEVAELLKRNPSFTCQYLCVGKEKCDEYWEEITGLSDKLC